MKITVGENERAFLFRNGRFVRMLGTGKHRLFRFLGEEVRRLDVDDEPLNADIPLPNICRKTSGSSTRNYRYHMNCIHIR